MNRFTLQALFPRYQNQATDDDFASAMASGFDADYSERETAPYAEDDTAGDAAADDTADDAADDTADDTVDDDTAGDASDDAGDESDVGGAGEDAGDDDAGDDAGEPATAEPPAAPQQPLTAEELVRVLREAQQPPKAEEQPPQEPKAPTLDDFISEEDREYLKTYDEEWGEVSKAERIRTNAAIQLAMAEAKKEWSEALAPIVQTLQQSQVSSFRDTVLSAHPDVDTVAPQLQGWIEQQPALVRHAYEQAYLHGSAEQVVELLNVYKQATGTGAAPQQQPASTPTPRVNQQQQQKQQRRAQAAQAAKATAAVTNSQRGDAPSAVDPDDFSAALDEAFDKV